ncbi:hypothetical protein ACJMK2_024399 [Sinanodonta woodiana]|uniref:Uncharacterized protein n=1 Tax=Sinanodonta woodiana TaxID=1069815 RepID=A0ABD3T781_SINWO
MSTLLAVFLLILTAFVWKDDAASSTSSEMFLNNVTLHALNKETRKSLLTLTLRNLNNTMTHLQTLRPQLDDCRKQVHQATSACRTCVQNLCHKRQQECLRNMFGSSSVVITRRQGNGQDGIFFINNGGVIYTNMPSVTTCSIVGRSRVCDTIMNPGGTMIQTVTSIGDNLQVQIGNVYNNIGGQNTITFLNGLQTVITNTNGTMTKETEEKVKKLLRTLTDELRLMNQGINVMVSGIDREVHQMTAELNRDLSQMNHDIQSSVGQVNQEVHQMTSDLNHDLNQMNSQINQNIHQMVSGLNQDMHQMNTGLSHMGQSISTNMNQFATNLQSSLQSLFANLFGRRRRAAVQEMPCSMFGSSQLDCTVYQVNCTQCQNQTRPADMVKQVCGEPFVREMEGLNYDLDLTMNMYNLAISPSEIISSVGYNKTDFDLDTLSFPRFVVTINGRSTPLSYISATPLYPLDLTRTASKLADEIWAYWRKRG